MHRGTNNGVGTLRLKRLDAFTNSPPTRNNIINDNGLPTTISGDIWQRDLDPPITQTLFGTNDVGVATRLSNTGDPLLALRIRTYQQNVVLSL